jgi:hypothetical protein
MKRIALVLASVLVLAGCNNIYKWVDAGEPKWVYDSYWNLIMQSTEAATSKEIQVYDSGDIQSKIDEYKLANPKIDVFVMDAETPIEEAPEAVVYIVKPDTHEWIKVFTGVPRTMFVTNAAQIDLECRADGGELYVDVVPPAPLPADETYKYYIYLIAEDGSVLYSTQTTEELFYGTLTLAYQMIYTSYPGSRVVHGELYKP